MYTTVLISVFCFLSMIRISWAQQSGHLITKGKWGFFGDIHVNQHIANFASLPNIPNCCPTFSSGINESFAGTFGAHLPLSNTIVLRPSFTMWDGTLRYSEFTKGGIGGSIVDVEIGHSIQNTIRSVGIECLYIIPLFRSFQASLGARADYIYKSSYYQQEELLQTTAIGMWNNGSTIRNVFSGDIPNAHTIAFAPSAGFHYTFAANSAKTILLSPEFLVSYNIIPSIKNYQWNILAWRFGCAITFNNEKKIDSLSQYDIKKQTPIVSKPIIPACDAFIKGIDSTGKQFDISTITIKETEINRLQPLLPFVFFDEDSFTIPSRYRLLQEHEASTFDINGLTSQSKLEVYWSLLDIIGYRLQKNPTASITLTGCNAHKGNEKNNIDLSRKRAEQVRLYLHTIWHIPVERCSINARNLPNNASISHAGYEQDISDAQQENRRVEISSDNFSILEPVHISAKIVSINPESILYSFPEQKGDSIINRNIEIKTDNGQLIQQTISGNIANFKAHLSGIATQLSKQNDDNLISTLTMYDAQQVKCKTGLSIPIKRITQIEHKHNDTMYNEYSLVLFPFNASTIEQNNKRIISMIKSELNPGASISIAGFTDRVGVYNHNKTLSYNRALAVYKALNITSDIYSINPLTDIVGYGEQDVHELPEGRLYWRTVNIFVKNPLSKP